MITFLTRKSTSSLALAIALATGTATIATAVMPVEANAQRNRDRDRDRDRQESDGGGYSNEFRAAYVPIDEAMKEEGADVAALRPQIDALIPLLKSNDEKIAGGGLLFNAGATTGDRALQLNGMELMLASGKVPAENIARYNFIAYQLANGEEDFLKARTYLQGAIDNNFTNASIGAADLKIAMAENFFAAQELDAGYNYLKEAIASSEAQNGIADERWYRRGVLFAYENESVPEVYDFAGLWVTAYPTEENWRDAINITRNLNSFEAGEILDLFRLGRKLNVLKEEADYDFYVEAADARRYPQEVRDVIEEGRAAGVISSNNLFIDESFTLASSRVAADRADLPALESDANASSAGLRTVVAAGDAFLSYGEAAKAAGFYQRSLGMAGVDAALVNLRLGMAKVEMGDFDGARMAFAAVTGKRAPIAKLWSTYADQLAAATTAAPAPAPAPAAPAAM